MNKRGVVITGITVLAATSIGVGAVAAFGQNGGTDATANKPAPASTAEVTRQQLVQQDTVDGTLEYAGGYQVMGAGGGVLTWLPNAGQTIAQGKAVYSVNGHSVPLFRGDVPFWRPLKSGMDNGPDVKVLEQNLKDLGYFYGVPGEKFTDATAAAVKRWQKALGVTQTGVVDPADAVVLPVDIRVATVDGVLGQPAQGKLIGATGTGRRVVVKLSVTKQKLASVDAKVDVSLPNGQHGSGKVISVGTVVNKPDPNQPSGTPTIDVVVGLDDPGIAGSLDGSPVRVSFTSERKENVLTVPVSALLALAEGGYAVELVDGSGTHLVKVELGMFSGGRVEVKSSELRAGAKVKAAGE
ncbi:peptidoglycan-binding protein [Kutzneria viridogrisea]|uniref:Peptidoglycan binding-like domain-containing protein n=2 Tax=Kutzneria TaxID=43356 RepID=W5WE21_9PSEU|nr:peptidoglycan-binding protein [Kutzneria albida]AHH99092.1 hypothetical protein KALB_5731 [Kutzneria albida DSM 43870]MBA8923353.1 peptidoglycan hydrolase-like protein with peptidoglycan-binding domain [Kutzneria viridogrisea]